MRAKLRILAVAPALCFTLLAGAVAQTNQDRQAAPQQSPSVANPNPNTATPRAPDMQTYRGMLQKAVEDLRQEISRVEGGAQPRQQGAMPPEVIHLMQTARSSWQIAQRAPMSFARTPAYDSAMQDMRHHVADISHERPSKSAPEAVNAARGVLQSLEKLNQEASARQPS
ncbi:hypothetical protein [Roseomonas xinghualingensis]|uniref:hypothetical protein n=1 Tax=Roseomonas xinghualingensis TaxID=2986475 RepID=UPI0021F162FC|nr:hypothetical protein [Roseomonas sp. SXEYE001]MCV4208432.1 hypothetical protein [Roseomonas sp. SXEYE001]